MTRQCTVCARVDRATIDKALLAGASFRDIARRFSLSRSALERHKAGHLPAVLLQSNALEQVAHADDLIAQLSGLHARTLTMLDAAEAGGDLRTALQAIREVRSNLELMARLVGDLTPPAPTVNVLLGSPDWARFRNLILITLEPFPEARLALAAALDIGNVNANRD